MTRVRPTTPAGTEAAMPAWMTAEADVEPAYDGEWDNQVDAKANYWLQKVVARAKTVAPCLKTAESLPEEVQEAAKGIIVGAVLRLLDSSGSVVTESTGPHSVTIDTKFRSDRLLSTADRDELQQLCRSARRRSAPRAIRSRPTYIPS